MGKHLTEEDINAVVELIDGWPMDTKFTWDKLTEAVKANLFDTTRQTLSKQVRIDQAYQELKGLGPGITLKGGSKKRAGALPPSLKIAQARLEEKDRKIERLERENQQLLQQFHVWLYNASLKGMTPEQLNVPLPNSGKM